MDAIRQISFTPTSLTQNPLEPTDRLLGVLPEKVWLTIMEHFLTTREKAQMNVLCRRFKQLIAKPQLMLFQRQVPPAHDRVIEPWIPNSDARALAENNLRGKPTLESWNCITHEWAHRIGDGQWNTLPRRGPIMNGHSIYPACELNTKNFAILLCDADDRLKTVIADIPFRPIFPITLTVDGFILAGGERSTLHVWNSEGMLVDQTLIPGSADLECITALPEGGALIGSSTGHVYHWKMERAISSLTVWSTGIGIASHLALLPNRDVVTVYTSVIRGYITVCDHKGKPKVTFSGKNLAPRHLLVLQNSDLAINYLGEGDLEIRNQDGALRSYVRNFSSHTITCLANLPGQRLAMAGYIPRQSSITHILGDDFTVLACLEDSHVAEIRLIYTRPDESLIVEGENGHYSQWRRD